MAGGSGDGKGFDALFLNLPFVFCDEDCLLPESTIIRLCDGCAGFNPPNQIFEFSKF
ncbi:hypothetical protein AALP_AA8G198400 [Arabis alpina]|uniref:Uncharacterized protein n=1 Tax=Arabis alpina TaxID=50452 RepID=A0A087G861_ARAAL|nr:hypothetical protein AALP_AA8G198400 [Arabis alpina]